MGIVKITNDNYKELVEDSKVPVLLDFYANWCGPCQMVAPVLEEIAAEKEGEVVIGKIDVDNERTLAAKFKVMSIPTLVLVKDGKVANKVVGAQPKQGIMKLING